jgi:hypothetical protein
MYRRRRGAVVVVVACAQGRVAAIVVLASALVLRRGHVVPIVPEHGVAAVAVLLLLPLFALAVLLSCAPERVIPLQLLPWSHTNKSGHTTTQ